MTQPRVNRGWYVERVEKVVRSTSWRESGGRRVVRRRIESSVPFRTLFPLLNSTYFFELFFVMLRAPSLFSIPSIFRNAARNDISILFLCPSRGRKKRRKLARWEFLEFIRIKSRSVSCRDWIRRLGGVASETIEKQRDSLLFDEKPIRSFFFLLDRDAENCVTLSLPRHDIDIIYTGKGQCASYYKPDI